MTTNFGLRRGITAVVLLCGVIASCGSADDGSLNGGDTVASGAGSTPINELQYIGTHNSYRVQPSDELYAAEKEVVGSLDGAESEFGSIDSWLYSHAPLPEQLADGIRSFELDVWADPEGGRFSEPIAAPFLGVTPEPVHPAMSEPGFKVFHIVDVDTNSTCPTLVLCLTEVRDFIEGEPDGAPIVILIELKDDPLPEPIDVTEIVPIDAAMMDDLDAEIRSVFTEEQILSPDDVRGDAASLRAAVETDGWPMVSESGGTVMFLMDNAGQKRLDYLEGHPNLEGRVLFTTSGEGEDDGAVLKVNTPEDGTHITELVEQGWVPSS